MSEDVMEGNFTYENTINEFCRFLRLIGVIVTNDSIVYISFQCIRGFYENALYINLHLTLTLTLTLHKYKIELQMYGTVCLPLSLLPLL